VLAFWEHQSPQKWLSAEVWWRGLRKQVIAASMRRRKAASLPSSPHFTLNMLGKGMTTAWLLWAWYRTSHAMWPSTVGLLWPLQPERKLSHLYIMQMASREKILSIRCCWQSWLRDRALWEF
jgi:hypothetical protein